MTTTHPTRSSFRSLLVFLAVIGSILAWHVLYDKSLSLTIVVVIIALCAVFVLLGQLFLIWITPSFRKNIITQFLCGFFVFNTALYIMTFATHFTPVGNAGVLIAITAIASFINWKKLSFDGGSTPGILCVIVSGLGAALWCSDALSPPITDGPNTVFPVWTDAFIHIRHISQFAYASGYKTVFNIEMSQAATPLYHYAIFTTPALLVSTGQVDAYESYVSFFLPFGVALTGLAAFSIISFLFGEWPALAATVAVVLIPDAYQQGFGSKFLGYYFIQLVCPGGLYGVAWLAIAWMFILEAIQQHRLRFLVVGYLLIAMTLFYRSHFLFATAFIALGYPCLRYQGLNHRQRLIAFLALAILFFGFLAIIPSLPGVPVARLSFATTQPWAELLLSTFDPGWFKTLYSFLISPCPALMAPLFLPVMLLLSTFGFWIVLWPIRSLFRKGPDNSVLFPSIIIINYLILGSYLQLDFRGIHTPEELPHRPFVWAYFIAATFTAAHVYHFYFGDALPRQFYKRICLGLAVLLCALIALVNSKNIQTMPQWPGLANYRSMSSVPNGLLTVSRYINEHSTTTEIVQDSENDTFFKVTAFTERQDFAIKSVAAAERSPALNQRLEEVEQFKKMSDRTDILKFARDHDIAWFILEPTSSVGWPSSINQFCVLKAEGYSLYRFSTASPDHP